MKRIIACDPGVGGGFCIGDTGSPSTEMVLIAMPETLEDIRAALSGFRNSETELWLEDIPKYTGKNRNESTTAVLFQNFGRVEGIAVALGIPIHRVAPKVWQSVLGIGIRGDIKYPDWKRKLKGKAQDMYPQLDVTLKTADALLIWHYGKGGGR